MPGETTHPDYGPRGFSADLRLVLMPSSPADLVAPLIRWYSHAALDLPWRQDAFHDTYGACGTLVTEYMTVDIAEDGGAVFLTDIYGYGADYAGGNLPPKVQTRWGSPILRPAWVPVVPGEVVEGWRKKGKPAPHDYDPKRDGG